MGLITLYEQVRFTHAQLNLGIDWSTDQHLHALHIATTFSEELESFGAVLIEVVRDLVL